MLASKVKQVEESSESVKEHSAELAALNEAVSLLGDLGVCPTVTYDNLEEALNHKNTLAGLEKDLSIK
jgi:hypothetical protein